ncbi:hypothetical protein R3P38DRAFT_3540916 [Favolaschia claudopus]|uniref:Uncharacterized protein n=1 Tax=Favolaschia claudopus TaxID=2862362 RepID=A0AAW0B7E2_9AGAR
MAAAPRSSRLPSPASTTPAPASVPSVLPSTSSTVAPTNFGITPHRPVTAFTGLARPSTASVQQARQASIQRNLHGSSAGSSSLTAASAIPTSPKKKRKSGPPRSYTDTPASVSALHDFAAVSAPTTATICLTPRMLTILLIFPAEEIENVQTTLKTAGLVFNAVVSTTGPIFEDIELAFRDHCATNNIDYVAPSLATATPSPNTMSYVLLGPRGRANGRTWVEDPKSLTRFTFTLQSLRSAPYSHTPNNLGDGLLVIAIYLHPLTACSGQPTVSPIMCFPTGALDDVYSIHNHSTSNLLLLFRMALTLATAAHMPGSGAFAMAAWQNHLLMPREMDDHVTITASSVDEGARALIVLCLWLCSRPTSVKLKELVNEQFTSPRPTIENAHLGEKGLWGLRARIEQGVGRGPRNEVVARAVKILVSDGRFWTEREGYLTLCLHPSRSPIPYRFCISKATGLIFLLHFLFIGAPLPVSPFLFYTLFDGRVIASKFDVEFLANFMSHHSLSLIKRIAGVPLDQPLYSSTSEYCEEYQYLVNIPGVDPSMISPCRSEAEHAGISDCVVSFAQLGTVDIERYPDYLATGDGFNVVVEAFGGQDRPHHVLEWFATPCQELIKAAFDRQVKAASDILRFLFFEETNPADNPWGDNHEMIELISRFVIHYLLEPGHPHDPDKVIGALIDADSTAADSILRARLFLSVTTGSTLLPITPAGFKIKCLITHDHSEEYPTLDAQGNDDFGPDVVIDFRSCFKTFSLTNNARLRHLLVSDDAEKGKDTTFGRFFHGQLLAACNSYTSS